MAGIINSIELHVFFYNLVLFLRCKYLAIQETDIKLNYLDGNDMIDKMLQISEVTQKKLALILEISESTLSSYRKTKVSRNTIKKFLQKFPNVKEEELLKKESNGYFKNLHESIGISDEGTLEFAEALMNVSARFGTKRYIDSLKGRESELVKKLYDYTYENCDVSGYLAKSYKLRQLEPLSSNKIKFMPIGFCIDKRESNCVNCFACPSYITTKDFLPVLKACKLTIDALEELIVFRGEIPFCDTCYYSKDISKVLADFII